MHYYDKMNINKLTLWKDNARYSKTLESEEECLEELFGNKNMNKKQKVLLNDIFLETDVIENLIVYKEEINENEFQYIVLDGNRRLSLFKINNYPELIKKYDLDVVKLNHLKDTIKSIDCKIYDDLGQAYKHVELRHLDEQNGKGTVKWASENKDRMKEIQGKEVNSIGFKILKFYESTTKPEFQNVKKQIKDKSTLDRIFGYKDTYNGIFGLNNKNEYDLYNYDHQKKINELLEKFYDVGGKVASVYTAKQSRELFSDVPSLPKNDNQISLDDLNIDVNGFKIKEEGITKVNPNENIDKNKNHNQYKIKDANLFNWTNKGIKSQNSLLNYYLKKLISSNQTLSNDKNLIMDLAPYFYRLLLDIAIRDITDFIFKGNADSILVQDFPKEAFNTTTQGVSCVNTNKINNIISICDKLRKNEYKNAFNTYKKELNKYGLTVKNTKCIDKFVNDLNIVVHGSSQTLSKQTLENYDAITLILIQLIYNFINLK